MEKIMHIAPDSQYTLQALEGFYENLDANFIAVQTKAHVVYSIRMILMKLCR
jgi:hypothetical protein